MNTDNHTIQNLEKPLTHTFFNSETSLKRNVRTTRHLKSAKPNELVLLRARADIARALK